VIAVKRLGGDYDSLKLISFIITNSLYSPKDLVIFSIVHAHVIRVKQSVVILLNRILAY